MGRIASDMPHVEPMLKDAAFNERVAREMEQIGRQGGRPGLTGGPGITGDGDARRLAEIYAEHAEIARRDANALGADIPQRQGWVPHTHDSMRLLRSGRAWRADHFRHCFKAAMQRARIVDRKFQDLRRTAIVRMAEAGCTVPEIASVSGHKIDTCQRIVDVYLPATRLLAHSAIIKLDAHRPRD